MDDGYRRDLSHLTWREVFERQRGRRAYHRRWFDAVGTAAGDTVVEVGSGPGYVTVELARRVGPAGVVYPVERNPEGLRFLERVVHEAAVENVRPVLADAEALPLAFERPATAYLTYVLHHAEHPARVLSAVRTALAPGSRLFVCEFHPDGPGDEGPPLDHRLHPDRLRVWLEAAGFGIDATYGYENESYAFLAT